MEEGTDLVATTVALIPFDQYNDFRIQRLSRLTNAFVRKLSSKPVLASDQNVEELEYILSPVSKVDFWKVLLH